MFCKINTKTSVISDKFKENFLELSNIANQKLEGWLDEKPLDVSNRNFKTSFSEDFDSEDKYNVTNNWIDDKNYYSSDYNNSNLYNENEEDPSI